MEEVTWFWFEVEAEHWGGRGKGPWSLIEFCWFLCTFCIVLYHCNPLYTDSKDLVSLIHSKLLFSLRLRPRTLENKYSAPANCRYFTRYEARDLRDTLRHQAWHQSASKRHQAWHPKAQKSHMQRWRKPRLRSMYRRSCWVHSTSWHPFDISTIHSTYV